MSLVIVFGCPVVAQPNHDIFRHLTTSNGLASNEVGVLFQDSKGYIWIGTQTGLQRYDGNRFRTYLADIHNPKALHTDWISAIFEDSRHRLWIGTAHGAPYLFNRTNGNFYNYNLYVKGNHKKIIGIWNFLEDQNGDIWIAATDGYFKLNNSNNQFESFNSIVGITSKVKASGISKDKNGNLWFATTGGVKELEIRTNKMFDKNYNPSHLAVFDIPEPAANIIFDNEQNCWVSTGYNFFLYKFSFTNKRLNRYSFERPPTKRLETYTQYEILGSVSKIAGGKIIVPLISRGIACYNAGKNDFSIIESANQIPYGLHLESFSSIAVIEDTEQNMWIGTDRGINVTNSSKQHFFTYGLDGNNIGKIPSLPVSDLLQTPSGDIYISYYYVNGGIVQLDSSLKFKHHYLYRENGNFNSLFNEIWNLFLDNDGLIWAPNQQKSILQLDTKKNLLSIFKDSVLDGNILQIQKDQNNHLWIAHWNKGLVEMDRTSGTIISYNSFLHPQVPELHRANCLLQDNNTVWVGSMANGLQLFDKKTHRFVESFVTEETNPHSISSNNIIGILEYNKDSLILATEAGINIFDKNKKVFTLISSKDGLPSNLVQAIEMDDQNNLWVACVRGICKVNMHTLTITGYDINDGIIDNGFNNRFLKLRDGRMMIGGSKSFTVFNPSEISESRPPPDVTITGCWLFDKQFMIDSFLENHAPLRFSYDSNSIRLEFASIQFNEQDKIKYYYKLEGVDKDWILANEHTAIYNQLNNGNYSFLIKCANRDGIFCKNITTLSIVITPPFWKTWWFRILGLVVFLLILLLIIKRRESKLKLESAQRIRIEQLSAEQLRNKLEMEKIINYFSFSLADKTTVDDVLWDVAKNLIGKLEFIDCIIYLWNNDKTKLQRKAGYGEKGSLERINSQYFDVIPGQGVVGYVCQTKQPLLIPDTNKDPRYKLDDKHRLSELAVPIIYNDELMGVIDTEHHEKNFFTERHIQLLTTIAAMVATKLNVIESERSLRQQKAELVNINQQLSEIQLAALRSQMNPHFIFNALNSIKTFVMENDAENAEKYLDKFAKLIRFILETTQSGTVLLQKEIDLLTLYLDLEQLRFSDKLTYTISISNNIDTENIIIPSMLIQPYVENAILHGIMHKETMGRVVITFTLFATWLEIIIEDDGVGRERSKYYKKNSNHHSLSMEITNKRLQKLKKDEHAGISIVDLKNENEEPSGTRVIIEIPL